MYISRTKNVTETHITYSPSLSPTPSATETITATAPRTITIVRAREGESNAQALVGALFQAAGSVGFGAAFYIFFVLLLVLAFQLGYYWWCSLFSPRVRVDTHVNVPWWIALVVMHTYIGGVIPCHYRCILVHGLQLVFHVYFTFFWSATFSLAFDLSETKSIIAIAFLAAVLPHMVRPLFHKIFYYYRADEDVIRELEWERQHKEREAKYGIGKHHPGDQPFFGGHGDQANGVSQAALDALDYIEFDADDDGRGSQDWSDDDYDDTYGGGHHPQRAAQFDGRNFRPQAYDGQHSATSFEDAQSNNYDVASTQQDYDVSPQGAAVWNEDDIVDIPRGEIEDDDGQYLLHDDGESDMYGEAAPTYDEDLAFVGLYRPSDDDGVRGLMGGVRDGFGGSDIASSGFAFEDFDSHYGENTERASTDADNAFYEEDPVDQGFGNGYDDLDDEVARGEGSSAERSDDYREDEIHDFAHIDGSQDDASNDSAYDREADRDDALQRPTTSMQPPTTFDDLHIDIQSEDEHREDVMEVVGYDDADEQDDGARSSSTAPFDDDNPALVATLPPLSFPPVADEALPHIPDPQMDGRSEPDDEYDEEEGIAQQQAAITNAAAAAMDFKRLWQQSSARTASHDNNLSVGGRRQLPSPRPTNIERFSAPIGSSAASVVSDDQFDSVASSKALDDDFSDGATELMVLPIKTYFKRGFIALSVLVFIILVADYNLLNELQNRDNNAFIRATLLAFLLDIVVLQQLYIGVYYLYRRHADPLGGESIVYELHPFEGEVREF